MTISFARGGAGATETVTDVMCGFSWQGVSVFEGDIVLAEEGDGAVFGGVVVFAEQEACFFICNLSAAAQRTFSEIRRIEVLGNVFDNPDLREIVEGLSSPAERVEKTSSGSQAEDASAADDGNRLPEERLALVSCERDFGNVSDEEPDADDWYREGFDPDSVEIYTDGACTGNPGPAGSAYVIRSGKSFMRSGSVPLPGAQTNNIAEITAVIAALRALPQSCQITLYSDSQYVIKAFNDGWLRNWQRNGWRTQSGPVKNRELWEQLLAESSDHDITWVWVRGHAGNADNELCDRLAVAAARTASKEG